MRGGGNSVISGDYSNFVDSTRMGSAKLPRRAVSDSWGLIDLIVWYHILSYRCT
jgi:hypothetical protein